MGEACGVGGGSGEGGSGGCGGESIGVAVQALTGCCCEVPVNGAPGRCWDVAGPDQCFYGLYTDGVCNPAPEAGACSMHPNAGDVNAMELFVLLPALALAAFRVIRRRVA